MNRTATDTLARLIDDLPAAGEVTEEACALADLASALVSFRAAAAVPRPEFKADLRATLLAAAREQATSAPPALTRFRERIQSTSARWRYSSRVAAATGATALALSGGGVSVAAERSLPNDVLYPAKLAIEDARIALVRDQASRGTAHLAQATTRVDEAAAVAASGDQDGAAQALRKADESARSGAGELIGAFQTERDPSAVHQLTSFADVQRDRLLGLDELLAGDAAEAARALYVGLERIEARALAVTGGCPTCAGGVPGPGVGFDFGDIPPADHPFMACPCEYRSSGGSPSAVAPAEPEEPPAEPVPAEEPPAPPPEPQVEEPPPPPEEAPTAPEPAVPVERPEPLADLREPLRETGGLLDGVLKDLLEGTSETVDDVTDSVDNLLGGE